MNSSLKSSALEPFGHGGDLLTASSRFGIAAHEWLDFSANINPLGPPVQVLEALRDGLQAIVNYPDPAHRQLKQQLAEKLRVDPAQLLIGNGAAECMALALSGLGVRKVGIVVPCFSEYAQLARDFGADVISIISRERDGFCATPEDLHALCEQVDLLFLGHPNNPTGLTYTLEALRLIARRAEETSTYLVLDEAFIDFIAPEQRHTLLPELNDYPHVILIHSMTKFYAIPGLRLGYTLAAPDLIERMARKQVTWSVNGLALLAGQACLQPSVAAYEAETRACIASARQALQTDIISQLGWQVWPGEANFLLIRVAAPWTASKLQQALGPKGILIRSCAAYDGLTERDIRIAVRSRAENERLLQALREAEQERGGLA